jgi:hypothetical protein
MRLVRFAIPFLAFVELGLGQTSPPVCQTVTADLIGPDGSNTAAIQAKLDACTPAPGTQAAVELSAAKGATFISAPLYLPSNVVLWLDAGVTLSASTNPADFQRAASSRSLPCDSSGAIAVCGTLDASNTGCQALINACKVDRAGVGGSGTIEGNGWAALTGGPNLGRNWWALATAAKNGNYAQSLNAPKMISIQQSTNATLSGFTIHNAPLVHMLLSKDSGVTVTGLTIVTPTSDHAVGNFPYNSDGLDISGSSNVTVDHVDFSDGDDNVALEGGGNGPVSNVSVTNSTFRAGHGFSIGSPTSRGVTNVTGNNIRFIGTDNGVRIKTDSANGGVVDQIQYSDMCMTGVKSPIVIDPYYSSSTGTLIPQFKNVEIDNLWADGGNVTFKGYAGQPPLILALNNVRVDQLSGVTAANANISEISDPNFPFPLAIPSSLDVKVAKSQSPAAPPADIKSYCQTALGLGSGPIQTVKQYIIDDTLADGNSQNQDLANNSFRIFNGRANNVRTDQVGSVTLDVTPAGTSSEAVWAFFTPSGSPVVLGAGDKLAVSTTFSLSGFQANGQDIRWGVLDSQGSRNTTNLTAGMNDGTFIGDTGYGLQFFPSGTGSPFVIGRRATLTNANVFNNFGDFATIPGTGASARQTLVDGVPYTLAYTIERLTDTTTRISAAVTGGSLSGLSYSAVEAASSPNTSFDYFAFRIGGTNFAQKITFTEFLVAYTPGPPVITSQPQPSSLVLQAGGKATIAIGAAGNQLNYQWQKDAKPIVNNPSALSPTLVLTNVQQADAGSYVAVISNAGGSVSSNAVVLKVSDTSVPPPPAIVTQPADTTVTIGGSTSLAITASGASLFYQWFKNGTIIPGATNATLAFSSAQPSDSASYTVVVSNPSGSSSSAPAALLVVSTMSPAGFRPWNLQTSICPDTGLYVAFDRAPLLGKSGKLRIYSQDGTLVDTLDVAASPQTRTIGGLAFNYYPAIITGNVVAFYLHQQLAYGGIYSITMDPGVVTDTDGAPFAGFSAPNYWRFTVKPAGPPSGSASLNVAWDGGDFCTVQGAIDFIPANNTSPVVVTVRKSIPYTGITYVPSNKPFIKVRGEDRDGSVLQYANNNNLNNGTMPRAMFGVDASDFTLENITLINTTPHGGSQAEAFRGNNQRILLNQVTLKSFQDTLMLQGTGFVTDSYIEGDVDFMWGTGAVFFRNSELKAVTSNGFYTQIRNGAGQNGNVYANCKLTAASGVSGMYLGRIDPTVFPYSQVVFINSTMGSHIAPVGWQLNNATTAPSVQFWEFGSVDANGAPINVSQRLPGSRQLTAAEAAFWSDPANVLSGWVPIY